MSKLRCLVLTLVLGVALLLLPFLNTRAEAVNPRLVLSSSDKSDLYSVKNAVNSVSKSCSISFEFLTVGSSDDKTTVTLNMTKYGMLKAVEKRDVMSTALNTISSSQLNKPDRIRLYNFVAEQDETVSALVRQLSDDVSADYATAYSWFRPFSGTVSTILGFLSIIIFVFLGIMIVLDLAFLVIPFFRNAVMQPDGTCKFVSNEAVKAVKMVESDTASGRSVLGVYFKMKVWQLLLLGVCLTYLVGGKIYDLVSLVIDSVGMAIG